MTASLKNINLLFPFYCGMPLGGGYYNIRGSFFMFYRTPIPKRLRFSVLNRDNFTCQYCKDNTKKLHVDHILPVSLGGTNDVKNLITACIDCNLGKFNFLEKKLPLDLMVQSFASLTYFFFRDKKIKDNEFDVVLFEYTDNLNSCVRYSVKYPKYISHDFIASLCLQMHNDALNMDIKMIEEWCSQVSYYGFLLKEGKL